MSEGKAVSALQLPQPPAPPKPQPPAAKPGSGCEAGLAVGVPVQAAGTPDRPAEGVRQDAGQAAGLDLAVPVPQDDGDAQSPSRASSGAVDDREEAVVIAARIGAATC